MPKLIFNVLILSCLAATGAHAATQALAEPHAETRNIVLEDFSFTPAMLEFNHGQHYVLRLINRGSGGHNFSSKAFFAAVTLDPSSQNVVQNGKIEVPKGGNVDVAFVAVTPGSYKLKCGHFLHSGFGMKGRILIR